MLGAWSAPAPLVKSASENCMVDPAGSTIWPVVALVPAPEVVALPPVTAMPPDVIRTWNWSLATARPLGTCLVRVTHTGVGVFWQALAEKVPAPVPVTVAEALLNRPISTAARVIWTSAMPNSSRV